MVNDEALQIKKKKKKKRRQSELAELDDSQIYNTKKKTKKLKDGVKSGDGVKKKKKKKKSLKNSTMISGSPEPVASPEDDVPAVLSDQELFGSQSPSPIKPTTSHDSPPPLTKHSPAEQNDKEPSSDLSDDVSDEEVKSPVVEPVVYKLSPVKKVAKKTKIVNKMLDVEESPAKKYKVSPESDDSGADEEVDEAVDEVTPLPEKEEAPAAPLSDPLISQHEQDQCDLVLLGQVRDKFPDTLVKNVNWNDLFVFNMTPAKMAARYDVLLSNIPREKSNRTLVSEAMEAYCNAKIREVPRTKQDPLAVPGGGSTLNVKKLNLKKKLNAFILFSSSFEQKTVSRDEIKERWENLDVQEKKRLKKEARALNNVHAIERGETKNKGPRPVSGYLIFSKELMNKGFRMPEVGAKWKTLTDAEKKEYQEMAEHINRERKTSHNEQAQTQ